MLNSGPTIDTGGNIAIGQRAGEHELLPGKSSRTIA